MSNEQMSESKRPGRYVRLQTKLGVGFTLLAILTSALLTVSLFLLSQRAVNEGIQRQLRNAVGIAALQIDGDAHSKITSPEDEDSEEYQQIRRALQLVQKIDPDVHFVQTTRLQPNGDVVFVVDAETDPELFLHVGEVYDTASQMFLESAATLDSTLIEPDFYTDKWGTWLTGYAPFYTSDGRREGFVSMDIAATRVKQHERGFLWIALTIFVIMAAISTILGFWIGRRMAGSIVRLTDGAKRIAGGDLDSKVEVDSHDEVEDLASAFNKMTEDLKVYMRNLEEATAARERIESELRIATDIQASMLPRIFPAFPDRKEFDIFASMEPAKEVAGDFYDFFLVGENKLCFLVGDVTGKGVPASLFMVISKTLLKTEALRGLPPNEVLTRVNDSLYPDNDACLFVTVFCVILDIETGEIEFANGGHNPPLLSRDDGDFEFMDIPKNLVVGPMPDIEYELRKLTLKPNDTLFLYTDGITEAMNPESQQFSDPRLKQCLSSLKGKGVEDITHAIRKDIEDFAEGAEQSDDITMLALKYRG